MPKDIRLNSTHCFIMKIRSKRELQQISLNHSSDTDFQEFMNLYKKCTEKPSFLVIDDKIKDEKLQHNINREAVKISALSSGKINKYEYLTGEEIDRTS